MTYGWAILIILIAVGALFYLGVFSPSTPSTCQMQAPFVCKDVKFQDEYILGSNTIIEDNLVLSLSATGITNSDDDNYVETINVNGNPCNIYTLGEGSQGTGISDASSETLVTCVGLDSNLGSKYNGEIVLEYKLKNSDITHKASGQFSGTVEEPTTIHCMSHDQKCGDINHDGNIEFDEGAYVNQLANGMENPNFIDNEICCVDANEDGEITFSDAVIINQWVVGGGPPQFTCSEYNPT